MFGYLDESDDLDFSERSTKYFILVLLCTTNPKEIGNIIKHVRQRRLKKSIKQVPELKFNKSDEVIRRRVLEGLARKSFEAQILVLEKAKVYERLRDQKNIIYNWLSGTECTEGCVN